MRSFVTSEPIAAHIDAAGGSVRVVATDRDDTVVAVRPRDGSRSADVRAAEQTRVHYYNGRLTVSASRRGFPFQRPGAVDIDIALPSRSGLTASVASADVRAEGRFGDCQLSSVSGNLDIGAVEGNLEAGTASGSITVGSAAGELSVATASGATTIGDLDGHLKFQAVSGALTVDRLCGSVLALSESGSVTIVTAVRGTISATTGSGAMKVGVAENTAARFDLLSGSGKVANELHPSQQTGGGYQTLLIQARTGSGDVDVHRAATTPA
jgi:hypothetical protein